MMLMVFGTNELEQAFLIRLALSSLSFYFLTSN